MGLFSGALAWAGGRVAKIVGKKLRPKATTIAGVAAGAALTGVPSISLGAPKKRRRRKMPTAREMDMFEHAMDLMKGHPTVKKSLGRKFARKFRF